jgi:hypothetical protein
MQVMFLKQLIILISKTEQEGLRRIGAESALCNCTFCTRNGVGKIVEAILISSMKATGERKFKNFE